MRTIIITQRDMERLLALIDGVTSDRNREAAEALESELGHARVVAPEDVPADVVTMNSTVRFVDEDTGVERQVALVYPKDAAPEEGRVSVLAPVGAALVGLRKGDPIDWPVPGGRSRRLRIVEVVWQPEAAGRLDL